MALAYEQETLYYHQDIKENPYLQITILTLHRQNTETVCNSTPLIIDLIID